MINMTDSVHGIGIHDVLLGRGGQSNNHPGNQRFRSIVKDHQRQYLAARKKDKALIAHQVVAIVHSNRGRFLKQSEDSDTWVEVPDKRALAKASQALREGLYVRNNNIIRQKEQVRQAMQRQLNCDSFASGEQSPANIPDDSRDDLVPQQQQASYLHYQPIPSINHQNHSNANHSNANIAPGWRAGSIPQQQVFLHYQPPPISQDDLCNAYQV